MKKINELSGESRIWIYQPERAMSIVEADYAKEKLESFIDEWSSHGQKMEASAEIFHNRFLVIAADEAKATASGCGIDKSVHFVKELGAAMNLDFFKRTQVVYRENGKMEEVELNLFWAKRKAGLIDDSTILFDNTIRKVSDLENNWEVPFSKSWHAEMWLK
jgi:hypothetical protein